MSITGGSLTRMKAIRMMAMRTALVLSCLFLAGRSTTSIGSQSAPRPCVVLRTDPAQGVQPPEGRLGSGGGWEWEPAGAPGSIAVTQGCTLTVWTEEGGHQTFPSGTQVHLKGWEWTSQPLAFHCSCEKEGVQGPVDERWEHFKEQHIDSTVDRGNDDYCNRKMKQVNERKEDKCKKLNTFIHARKEEVIKVCRQISKTENHCSTKSFNLTECKQTRPCMYKAWNGTKKIIIVCWDGKPVHFNGTRNECIQKYD